ncbi:L-tyrosine/L-tryptophan isonitrile synthase family protein [bacterium AH-315-M05]|nr:L-tyrosine/L-tryptophan isonitrile synthase family protein [bacterium AH-315-M05]
MRSLEEVSTSFEKKWNSLLEGHRIVSERALKYDSPSGILYFPASYTNIALDPIKEQFPDDSWIIDSFKLFVRGEFGKGGSSRGPYPFMEKVQTTTVNISQVTKRYLENCETELVYSGLLDGIRDNYGSKMEAQIYGILCDSQLGNKENKKNIQLDYFSKKIKPLISNKERLLFVFPAFPFKDQNIFRTNCPADHIDMAEVVMIIHLHILSLALYQVHPYGVDWVILSDGTAYSNLLGVKEKDALEYRAKLMQIRNELNLQQTVKILDLKKIATSILGEKSGPDLFNKTTNHISKKLQKFYEENKIYETLRILVRGMKWNCNFKPFFKKNDLDFKQAWELLNAETCDKVPNSSLKKMWEKLDKIGINAAIEYAAFNLSLKYHNIYQTFFPDSIRATIHPKKNQIAVPGLGPVYPWNGICLAKDNDFKPHSLESIELYKLMGYIDNVNGYCAQGIPHPFYYLKNKKK